MGLAEVYARWSHDVHGGDKGTTHNYLPVYERVLDRTHRVSLLEVGVCFGHSVGMWGEYLTDSDVVGLDVDLSRLWFPLPGIHLIQVDATDRAAVDAALGTRIFNYIIDDGSHAIADQLATFDILWRRVRPGGAYVIEDIDGTAAAASLGWAALQAGAVVELYDGREAQQRWDEMMLIARRP